MRNGNTRTLGSGFVLLIASMAIALSIPTPALALDSDLKGSAIFRLEASNGYSILGFAASERADGRGDIVLIVHGKRSSVLYAAPATVTPTKLDADLGDLGQISLDIAPSGTKRTLRSRCGGEPLRSEPNVYRGTFEFHGEEGYTEASATTLHEYTRFTLDFGCGVSDSGEVSGEGLPGAKLRLLSRGGSVRVDLQANKNRPGARSRFEVEIKEKRGRIGIARTTTLWASAAAFAYDPSLRTATLDPPAPFSGRATYRRGAPAANRWTGNLAVDLPGRSAVPLTSSGAHARLVPACWHEGEGRFPC
jgi:hypothetical protein